MYPIQQQQQSLSLKLQQELSTLIATFNQRYPKSGYPSEFNTLSPMTIKHAVLLNEWNAYNKNWTECLAEYIHTFLHKRSMDYKLGIMSNPQAFEECIDVYLKMCMQYSITPQLKYFYN